MKILLLSVHPPEGGGSAYSSQELACGLRRLGHEVLHISPYKSAVLGSEYPGLIWFPADFPADLNISPKAQSDIDYYVQSAYRNHGPFDYVILGRESFLWHLPAVRRVHHNKPVILICRGAYINRLASSDTIESSLKEKLIDLYKGCDRIICIARHLVESLDRVVGVNNTVFLPNPIDLPFLNATDPPAPSEQIRLLMAAQIKPRKRPLDAVEIIRILVERQIDVHLTICGDGSDMPKMLNLIALYGLEKHILVKGRVARQEVLDCLNSVETVLLCSDNEGRPRVLQEAIAAGKGIVAYDNPGSREVVNEWLNQWPHARLVDIGDKSAASQAILDLACSLRSKPEPLSPPQLPQAIEVLYEYESMLKSLKMPRTPIRANLQPSAK
ncbi:glycosyltransferase family 4 protein [Microcoleus sp. FACHB-831]|uniref:glycosyltransferase family 4 protein n=1 Tax=Microcoleus sp. FACHB-831 TaxID=2692827 RepID=UPI001682BB11|nr:glycosyltransferase family 4 protein [Microcoleus sp. FACHB-831]MBD1923759.1 glycosyltransferase family 4 protein [Microcoleus sp. FACHB-831]